MLRQTAMRLMMDGRVRSLLISAALMILCLVGCTKPEDESTLITKEFSVGQVVTKATDVFVKWREHDCVGVYSLDKDGFVMWYDAPEVVHLTNTNGKITATVAKEAASYYFTYPADALISKVGDKLDTDTFNVHVTGELNDAAIMTSSVKGNATAVHLSNRFGLLKFWSESALPEIPYSIVSNEVELASGIVSTVSNEYYVPVCTQTSEVTVNYMMDGHTVHKTGMMHIGVIHPIKI